MMPARLTIRDIARLAGVSTATVSRVLNQRPDVDPATRERILRIVAEQGFVPSISAAGLAGGRTQLLGMLVPSLTWGFMPTIMSGVADIIEQTSYELVLYCLSHKQERSAVIDRILASKLIDGLLAVYPDGATRPGDSGREDHRMSRYLTQLYEADFPVVIIDDQGTHERTPWISPDNRTGAEEAVRHLIDLGHRRIAHVQAPEQYLCSRDRYEGYVSALRSAGLAVDPEIVITGDFTTATGHEGASRLFALPDPPTAVFAANDSMAIGVLSAAAARGLRVPEDVAVVGFDDAAPAAYAHPPLTTVRQPFFEMGQRAAEVLVALAEAPRPPTNGGNGANGWQRHAAPVKAFSMASWQTEPVHIQLPTRLVIRESCGAAQRQLVTPET